VCFVQNEDLVSVSGWGKNSPLSQVTGIVNTVVTCRVNLDDIE
jgi:hypothetical protein